MSTLRRLRFDAPDRGALLACAAAGALFLILGFLSDGTHNDDDISRYLNVRAAWSSPERILSVWNRPAFVLAYMIPARLGYAGIKIATALISMVACYLTYRAARSRGWQPSWLVVVLLATQPFFLALSCSGLSEPLAACLLAAALLALDRKRLRMSALILSAAPLARPELTPLFLIWAVPLARARAWRAIASLPLGLALWALAGFLAHGDPLWLLRQIFTGEDRIYQAVEATHYLGAYIFAVGPVVFVLSVPGLVDAVRRRDDLLIPASVVLMLAVYTWLSVQSSAGQAAGFVRYLVTLAPFTALLAMRGFPKWAAPRLDPVTLLALVVAAVLCGTFLSVELEQGVWLGNRREYTKLAVVSIIAGVALARFVALRRKFGAAGGPASPRTTAMLAAVVSLLAAGFTLARPPIARLNGEQRAMREAAHWYRSADLEDRVTLCNHPWFHFFAGTIPGTARTPVLCRAALDIAPEGAVAIWEGHYGHRHGGDVMPEDLDVLGDWRVRRRIRADQERFAAVVLEKLPAEERAGRVTAVGYGHPGFGVEWADVGSAPGWVWERPRSGLYLFNGSRDTRRVYLHLIRFVGLSDPQMYYSRIETQLRQNPALVVETVEALGDWIVVWGHDPRQQFFLASHVGNGRCEALQLSGTCTAADVPAMREQLLRWLPLLRFVPGPEADAVL